MPPSSSSPAPLLPELEVRPQSLEHLTEELAAAYAHYLRVVAGFNALHFGYLTHQGKLPKGERARGLPLFSFSATATGHDTQTVTLDLARLPAAAVPGVFVPLLGLCYGAVAESVAEIEEAVAGIRQYLDGMLNPAAPAAQTAPAGSEGAAP
jgi:hypothetical protein